MNSQYEELGEIGSGGSGVVNKCRELFRSGSIVAIKEIQFPDRDGGVPFAVLRKIAKSSKCSQGILRQILLGVAYCHSHKIIHRDIKPLNILLDVRKGVVKIADFGLARPLDPPVNELSGVVGTMFYRSLEIMMGFTNYSYSIDMWAAGCIFAEMVNLELLEPLFYPAATETEVLIKIFRKMLCMNPAERISPADALDHEYFNNS